MVYSGAFFENWNYTLEAAQQAKLHKICTKLNLKPGQRLLDMGCGWGGLILHAAKNWGVHALGITLSEKQADFARSRISELGLQNRCRIEVRDLRSFDEGQSFHGVASVGAVEHVRQEDLPAYFRTALRALRPGGTFLSQGITRPCNRAGEPHSPFMQSYVFPDSNLIPLDRMIAIAEKQGFETRHVEAMTEHYAHTTRLWYERLGARRDEATEIVGRAAYRTFRLMLLGSSYNFTTGAMGLHQVLLAKRG
jgi:cyclopropane-fatty-acyl-phospholipid synthase